MLRPLFLPLALFLGLFLSQAAAQTCSPSSPCREGRCNKWGNCGFSPDGGEALAVLPQTTALFCGDKKVSHKTCSKTNGNARIISYYKGWASNRPCNVFWPEQIPVGLYTHVNFAFATIDPASFKVLPSSPSDIGLYKRLMHLK